MRWPRVIEKRRKEERRGRGVRGVKMKSNERGRPEGRREGPR
jgi:hypothetical protein